MVKTRLFLLNQEKGVDVLYELEVLKPAFGKISSILIYHADVDYKEARMSRDDIFAFLNVNGYWPQDPVKLIPTLSRAHSYEFDGRGNIEHHLILSNGFDSEKDCFVWTAEKIAEAYADRGAGIGIKTKSKLADLVEKLKIAAEQEQKGMNYIKDREEYQVFVDAMNILDKNLRQYRSAPDQKRKDKRPGGGEFSI